MIFIDLIFIIVMYYVGGPGMMLFALGLTILERLYALQKQKGTTSR